MATNKGGKLTDQAISEIRAHLEAKTMTQTELAKQYNVKQPQISRIKNNRSRNNLPRP